MNTKISAGGVVVGKTGRSWTVLLLKDMNGNWTFPKGLIEKGEEPVAAAQREVEEEVGIKNLRLLREFPPIQYMYYREGLIKKTVHYFLFESTGKSVLKPQKEEGIRGAKWFRFPEALKVVGYAKTNRPLLEAAQKFL